jgi:hypothetical protein
MINVCGSLVTFVLCAPQARVCFIFVQTDGQIRGLTGKYGATRLR